MSRRFIGRRYSDRQRLSRVGFCDRRFRIAFTCVRLRHISSTCGELGCLGILSRLRAIIPCLDVIRSISYSQIVNADEHSQSDCSGSYCKNEARPFQAAPVASWPAARDIGVALNPRKVASPRINGWRPTQAPSSSCKSSRPQQGRRQR